MTRSRAFEKTEGGKFGARKSAALRLSCLPSSPRLGISAVQK